VPTGRLATAEETVTGPGSLIDPGAAGFYRVSVYITASSASAGEIHVQIKWNDGDDRDVIVTLDSSSPLGPFLGEDITLRLADGEAIAYDISRTGGSVGTTFAVSLRAEAY